MEDIVQDMVVQYSSQEHRAGYPLRHISLRRKAIEISFFHQLWLDCRRGRGGDRKWADHVGGGIGSAFRPLSTQVPKIASELLP